MSQNQQYPAKGGYAPQGQYQNQQSAPQGQQYAAPQYPNQQQVPQQFAQGFQQGFQQNQQPAPQGQQYAAPQGQQYAAPQGQQQAAPQNRQEQRHTFIRHYATTMKDNLPEMVVGVKEFGTAKELKDTKSGIDNRTLDSLKKGRNITMIALSRLCRILNCSPNDIVQIEME